MNKDFIDETHSEPVDETSSSNTSPDSVKGPEMKYCPHCGKLKPAASRFCPECGRDQDGAVAVYTRNTAAPVYAGQTAAYDTVQPRKSGTGFAVAALVISIVNLFPFAAIFSFIAVPLAVVFAIIALKRRNGGKVAAIVSICFSVIATAMFAAYIAIAVKISPDVRYFVNNDRTIISNYDYDGSIPERYDKYRDSKYDYIWESYNCDSFDEFFGKIVDSYRESILKESKPAVSGKDKSKDSDTEGKQSETTKATDDISDELVVLS